MKLNEQYLHKVLMSSINNFITEDVNGETEIDFLNDIMHGDTVDVGTVNPRYDEESELIMRGESGYFYKILFRGNYEITRPEEPDYIGNSVEDSYQGWGEEGDYTVSDIEIYCDFGSDDDNNYQKIPYEFNKSFEEWLINTVNWDIEDYEDYDSWFDE